jgi:hypothetical protein
VICSAARRRPPRVAPDSIHGILHRECFRLLLDELFADLFAMWAGRSVLPMITAVVMALQRIEDCSDREAVVRFAFDAGGSTRPGRSSSSRSSGTT